MPEPKPLSEPAAAVTDLFIIGGGINGCGIARDAVGRGLSVTLAEMGDLASATSSGSTKLFHGGLRYLEYFEFRLVREALIEREVLLRAMPHISWPMRFVLPYHKDIRFESDTPTTRLLNIFMPWLRGQRPAWLIRLGLFMYDHMGGRKILPGTRTLDLAEDTAGEALNDRFKKAFEYSDCWVQDSRLVVLNARDAQSRGARIMTQSKVISAEVEDGLWLIVVEDGKTGERQTHKAKLLINAGGPWVGDIIQNTVRLNTSESVRLVRGSHIVTRRLFDHDRCYFFQGTDGRIIFAIPYEEDFTLIGTTDAEHTAPSVKPECTREERDYLLAFASQYLKEPVTQDDIVWSYSGVRPLYDDGAKSATAATRDYVLKVETGAGAPLLNVFGGKITTYRRLAESALEKIQAHFPNAKGAWTAGVPLPGGDFPVQDVDALTKKLQKDYPFLDEKAARRLFRTYGTETWDIFGNTRQIEELGQGFGAGITQRELDWAVENEWVHTAEDFLWRRTKLGLYLTPDEVGAIEDYLSTAAQAQKSA